MDHLVTEGVDTDTKSLTVDEQLESTGEQEVIGLLLHQEGEEGEEGDQEITVHLDPQTGMVVMPPSHSDGDADDEDHNMSVVDEDASLTGAENLVDEGSLGESPATGNSPDDDDDDDGVTKVKLEGTGDLSGITVSAVEGIPNIQHINVQNLGLQNSQGVTVGELQAYTLPDGSTAYLQQQHHPQQLSERAGDKNLEGQTVHLPDGSTAVLQNISDQKDSLDGSTNKGQLVDMVEGSFIQNMSAKGLEGIHAVQLEDGSTAYLTAAHFFDEHGHIDPQAVALEQHLTQQGVQPTEIVPDEEPGDADILPETSTPELKPTPTLGLAAASNGTTPNRGRQSVQSLLTNAQGTPAEKLQLATRVEKLAQLGHKAYKCAYSGCERLYTTQHHLKVHERSHTGDRPFKCEFAECGKAFATGYGLKSHIRVHTGEKPYRCPEPACPKAFKTSGDLQKHIRIHTGERPFKCPFAGCTRSFTTSNIRKVHIRTHTGERPYICEEEGCQKAFASATNYKNHIRIHSGEKPYVCTVQGCGKRFTEYSSLYKHHVVHTHTKPYVCVACGKTYRQTSTLAMHRRTAHGEDITAEGEAALVFDTVTKALDPSGTKAVPIRIQLMQGGSAQTLTQVDTGRDLVINTTEGVQPVTIATVGEGGQLEQGAPTILQAGQLQQQQPQQQQQQVTIATPQMLQQLQGQTITLAGDLSGGQQIYVVTDQSQLEVLQQLAQQQQQQQQQQQLQQQQQQQQQQSQQTCQLVEVTPRDDNGEELAGSTGDTDLDSSIHDTIEMAAVEHGELSIVTDPGQAPVTSEHGITVSSTGVVNFGAE